MHIPTKILVPVDFSEYSTKAIHTGAEYAQHFGAELFLCHVFAPPLYPEGMGFGAPTAEDVMKEFGERLKQLGAEAVGDMVPWTWHVWDGQPSVAIVEGAKQLGIDLIVIPTHGRTGFASFFIGSTAERVIRRAACQVLVLRCEV